MESPELETLGRVTKSLESASVPYMLTGSMALNFYGHPRATNDFDMVIEVHRDDVQRLLSLWKDDFYVSEAAIREALSYQRLFNIIDNKTVFKVDLIIKKNDPYSQEQFRRRQVKELEGLKIFVISPEDLILTKLQWSRESLSEMQERDIRNVLTILADRLDFAYLERWAQALGLWKRLKGLYVPS